MSAFRTPYDNPVRLWERLVFPSARVAYFRGLADASERAWDEGWYAHEIRGGSDEEAVNPYRRVADYD